MPRQLFGAANWAPDLFPANWAPHPPPLPTPCMAKDNNFVKYYNVFTTMKKSFYVNYMLPKGLQNYTKFASEWKALTLAWICRFGALLSEMICRFGALLSAGRGVAKAIWAIPK